ncbi:lysophospholipid acyltransferase family protein [Nitrincola nitratireducens]|uniref:1-acylglycerol-3-phosphate O-acyltransferase n=1 Tax=Nitrincola nitratireducens TaxID=1229521 RepID=W9VIH4_9GAMM|nr:lysophospholipid acyltransferase family protein [Nitrincola nitratireducens]EXJ10385.1 1-acylglycerol-3-phosphate O-acyltransferase [Nitrincola nitratireducens]
MLKFRAFLFALGFYPITILYSIPCLLIGPFLPFRQRFAFFTGINYFYISWLKWMCGVDTRVQGREHLPNAGAFVVLGNHQSEWETLYFQILVRPQVVVLKKELLKIPFFGWALGLLKPIALDRSQRRGALKQLLEQGAARLSEDIPIVMFLKEHGLKWERKGSLIRAGLCWL